MATADGSASCDAAERAGAGALRRSSCAATTWLTPARSRGDRWTRAMACVQASGSAGLPAKRLATLGKSEEYAATRGRIQENRRRSIAERTRVSLGELECTGTAVNLLQRVLQQRPTFTTDSQAAC